MIKTMLIEIKKGVRFLLRKLKYRLVKIDAYSIFDFESFLYRHIRVHKTLKYLQIGANDGVMNDPIFQFIMDNKSVVAGYALEPLPDIYAKLVKNYQEFPNIKLFNLAIHATESEMVLHRVNPLRVDEISDFARGIASFDKKHWEKTTLVPDVNYMEEVVVKCISFSNFIKSNGIENLDLLLIDTEGYDYEILMSIDFNAIKPKMIRFEHGVRNNVMLPFQFIEVCGRLNSVGYQIIAESYDATAYILDPSDLIFN